MQRSQSNKLYRMYMPNPSPCAATRHRLPSYTVLDVAAFVCVYRDVKDHLAEAKKNLPRHSSFVLNNICFLTILRRKNMSVMLVLMRMRVRRGGVRSSWALSKVRR